MNFPPHPPVSVPESERLRITVARECPTDYQQAVWEEFFRSRGRGISLHAHFPWLTASSDDTSYFLGHVDDQLAGGLVLKKQWLTDVCIGSIGLVYVSPRFRGRGISSRLLLAAIDAACSAGTSALRLWTRSPAIYTSAGFKTADTARFGTVTQSCKGQRPVAELARSDLAPLAGIPPFASGVEEVTLGDATVTLIHDANGPIVSSWAGPDENVATLLSLCLPTVFRFNAFSTDSLPHTLASRGWHINLQASDLQMILPLDHRSPEEWALLSQTPVTQRI